MADARSAVEGADIICTVTASSTPVVEGSWLAEGAHINAVGSSQAANRELDNEAVRRSRLFVDRRESARNEAGDYLIPLREGAIGEDHIVAEIGEVAAGMADGRRSAEEITLFKSLGLAIEGPGRGPLDPPTRARDRSRHPGPPRLTAWSRCRRSL